MGVELPRCIEGRDRGEDQTFLDQTRVPPRFRPPPLSPPLNEREREKEKESVMQCVSSTLRRSVALHILPLSVTELPSMPRYRQERSKVFCFGSLSLSL